MAYLPAAAIAPFGADTLARASNVPTTGAVNRPSFVSMVSEGLDDVSQKMAHADQMVTAFALDDSIPVHQVTYALEQARMSAQMLMQVRTQLLDGFQTLMRMQL